MEPRTGTSKCCLAWSCHSFQLCDFETFAGVLGNQLVKFGKEKQSSI